jgi:hypothetical protein
MKLEQALQGDLHILAPEGGLNGGEHRNFSIRDLKPLIRTHYIFVVAGLLSESFLDASLQMSTRLSDVSVRTGLSFDTN